MIVLVHSALFHGNRPFGTFESPLQVVFALFAFLYGSSSHMTPGTSPWAARFALFGLATSVLALASISRHSTSFAFAAVAYGMLSFLVSRASTPSVGYELC